MRSHPHNAKNDSPSLLRLFSGLRHRHRVPESVVFIIIGLVSLAHVCLMNKLENAHLIRKLQCCKILPQKHYDEFVSSMIFDQAMVIK